MQEVVTPESPGNYPVYVDPNGRSYVCIFWAMSLANGWEWYGFEADVEESDIIYFGLVHGFETELGYFSRNELKGLPKMVIETNAVALQELAPPEKWTKAVRV